MKKGKTEKVVTVVFEPDGCRVRVAPETTIFEAANKAGVSIRSECGGKGICGKCTVIVQDKNALTEATTAEMTHLSSLEIDSGYRLACQARVKQNIVAIIPPESRVGALKIEITGLERPVPLNPLVEKFHVTPPKPTLSDVRPDYERLLDCLKCAYRFDGLEIDYELLKKLPACMHAKEQFLPKVADRTSYPEFMEKGKTDALANAKERVKEILATHEPLPLPKDQDREIDRILEEVKEWYKEQGMW